MKPARALLGLVFAVLGSAMAHAASFPCDKAQTPDEKTICATLVLNDRDAEMAVRFAILKDLLPMGNRAKLQEDQEDCSTSTPHEALRSPCTRSA